MSTYEEEEVEAKLVDTVESTALCPFEEPADDPLVLFCRLLCTHVCGEYVRGNT
jgi:hypothetical protein